MKNRIKEVLGKIRPEFEFEDSQDFFQDGLLDSFDLISLVSGLDEVFGLSIEGDEILPENFENLEAIEKLILKYIED